MKTAKHFYLLFTLLSLFYSTTHAQLKGTWDKELVSKLILKDRIIINILISELKILEKDSIHYVEIYDFNQDGIGNNDYLKCVPSMKLYPMINISDEIKQLFQKVSAPPSLHEIGITINVKNLKTPQEAILFNLSQVIKENYDQMAPIKVYYEQNEEGLYRFDIWGYESDRMRHKK
jgi:hypothetical protein